MKKTYIICHMAASVDGRIDCSMLTEIPGGNEYYETLDELSLTATLCGRVTAEFEMAEKGTFMPSSLESLNKEGFSRNTSAEKYSVVVDTKGCLLWKDNLCDGSALVIVTSEAVSKDYVNYLNAKGISWIACGQNKIDLAKAVQILADELKVDRLGIVGGANINGSFLKAGLLDEVSILLAPGIDGRKGMLGVFDGLDADCEPFLLKLMSVKQYSYDTVWLRYKVEERK